MNLSIRWLSRYVDIDDLDPAAIRDAITMSTAEVEEIHEYGAGLEELVVGQVVEKAKHPGADKLSLCKVDVGGPELLPVVCGAPNVAQGQKVCVVQPGMALPDGTKIKKSKIRGEVSLGMICSERELLLSEDHEGIMVLPEASRVGDRFIDVLPVRDHVIEIDNKSVNHRPDLWGHFGFARELAAIFGRELRQPWQQIPFPDSGDTLEVVIEDREACPRYLGLIIDNVRAERSPDWMRYLLQAVGQRCRNQLVDLTNFVMLEIGQPMHAFDLRQLNRDSGVVIRRASQGEKITTLDEQEFDLSSEDLLITSGGAPVALAGVMGGLGSAVEDDTTALFLESATFHPTVIRRTSGRLGLRTDSSARFEKNLDPAFAEQAVLRFVGLLQELQPDARVAGPLRDPAGFDFTPPVVPLRRARLDLKLGLVVDDARVENILSSLQFGVEKTDDGFAVTVPSFRATKDISIEDDLIEEVGRMFRYDNIPEVPLRQIISAPHKEPELFLGRQLSRSIALELGCSEIYNYSFVPDSLLEGVGSAGLDYSIVTNPVAPEIAKMRRHVMPSVLGCVEANLRERSDVRLFEQGKGYHPENRDAEGLPFEVHEIAVVTANTDGRDGYPALRSGVQSVLSRAGYPAEMEELRRSDDLTWIHPGKTVALTREGLIVGYVGVVHPQVCERMKMPLETAIASLDLRQLLKSGRDAKKYQEIPRFPAQPVDVAFFCPNHVRVGVLGKFLHDINPKIVRGVKLFEVYRGAGVPEGQKSLNFTVTLGAPDRTLSAKDEEKYLTAVRERAGEFDAELRG